MKRLLCAATLACASSAFADGTTMIVLDASGSMWGQIDGVNKIVTARDVLRDTLGAVSDDQSLGLVAYGHRRKGDCGDIEVLATPATGQAGAIVAASDAINPRGKTPLTEAVRQAAQTMRATETKATVVLVTDGLETCGADPCALARELEATGFDFTTHVVGFGLSATDRAGVACLAEETGGRYFDADNAGELADALSLTVVSPITPDTVVTEAPAVEPRHNLQINVQLTPDSPPLNLGEIDQLALDLIRQPDGPVQRVGYEPFLALKAEEGDYIVRASYAGGQVDLPVTVDRFDVAHATIALNAGVVDFRAIALAPDLIPNEIISWRITSLDTGDRQERYHPELRSVFAAGRYEVTAIVARNDALASAPVSIEIAPGEVSEGEILLPHGALRVDNVSDTGERLPDGFMRFGLWTAKADGSPDSLVILATDTRWPMLSLPGDYVLVAEDWGIGNRQYVQPVTIDPGALASLRIRMPADPELPLQLVGP